MHPAIDRESLQALYRYNAHANDLLLDTLTQLSDAEYTEVISPHYTSIGKLAVHSYMTEGFFLAHCREQPFEAIPPSTAAELRTAWQALGQSIQQYLAFTRDDDLNRLRTIRMRGQLFQFPAWQLLTQALMHSTHHRGELALILGTIGRSLPDLDIIIHFWEETGQPWPWK